MKDQIKKVFSDPINFSSIVQDEQSIKLEPTYHQKNLDRSTGNQGFVRKINLLDKNGEISRCNVRGSIYQIWTKQCPES